MTAFTELTVLVKLVAVRGDGWFTAAALFLVAGWAALQSLLALFHRREMSEMEMAAAVRVARALNAELKEHRWWWDALFVVLHLPFFGYPAYLVAFLCMVPGLPGIDVRYGILLLGRYIRLCLRTANIPRPHEVVLAPPVSSCVRLAIYVVNVVYDTAFGL